MNLLLCLLLLFAVAPGSAYYTDKHGQCVRENGDGPLRIRNGFAAPTTTDSGLADACGCDPPLPDDYERTLQINRPCPFNAEPLLDQLYHAGKITPADLFLKRNHGPIPVLKSPQDFVLVVRGAVQKELRLSIQHLTDRHRFPPITTDAVVVCAGNRRNEYNLARCPAPQTPAGEEESDVVVHNGNGGAYKSVSGVSWGAGALGAGRWRGASVADVLKEAGPLPGAAYVEFEGADYAPEEAERGSSTGFSAAIPLDQALNRRKKVMLAYEMNGKPLPRWHGAPVRSIVPGNAGFYSVKWLIYLTVLEHPSSSYFIQRDYKLFATNVLPRANFPELLPVAVWDAYPTITNLNVQVTIAEPAASLRSGVLLPNIGGGAVANIHAHKPLHVSGWAFSGGGQRVQAVYVCALTVHEVLARCDDAGRWWLATLQPPGNSTGSTFTWSFWQVTLPALDVGYHTLVARGVDTSSQSMPQAICPLYNWRGVMNNAWFKLSVSASEPQDREDRSPVHSRHSGAPHSRTFQARSQHRAYSARSQHRAL